MGVGGIELANAARHSALLAGTERLAQTGSWCWDVRTDDLIWSDNLFRLFGFEPGAITPTLKLVHDHTHPDDRERVVGRVDAARAGNVPPIEWRIRRRDGEVRHLRSTIMAVEELDHRPVRVIGSMQDVTDRRRAEREIAAHAAVSEALTSWSSLDEGGAALLRGLAEAMEFETGTLWTRRDGALEARVVWSADSFDAPDFEAVTRALRLPKGAGLPGQAWALREPIGVADLIAAPASGRVIAARREAAVRAGLRSALAFPALRGDEVLAVLDFSSRENAALTDRLMRSLTGIAYELGHFLDRRRGELAPPTLTARELEIVQLAARGASGPQIAVRLVISRATVKTHFENIYEKLGVGDRASAVAKALRLGLIE
jgi:PAS domain S-box-containing protein